MEDFKHIDKFSDCIKHNELKILEPTTQELDKLRLLVCSDLTQKHIWEETGEIKANSFEETIFYALSILNLSVGDFLIITIQKDSYK